MSNKKVALLTVFLDWISKNIEIQKEYLYKWKK